MSKLNIDQKSIKDLFSEKKSDFLIPDYQRPYAWEEKECQTLWDDIFNFAIPDNDATKFDSDNDEYFLGPIVTFKNEAGKLEIIDGQQRLTTLMLLLRAFYSKYANMMDTNAVNTREMIAKCIWKTDEFGNPRKNALKIDSEVASDNDKDVFLNILLEGTADAKSKSSYANNYRFFQSKIDEFIGSFPGYFSYLPIRILNNCILLPIEAESQDTALRIFSTLNDRGLPLSDADIFKAQFYKFYTSLGKKDWFIQEWKKLEETCNNIFNPIYGTPMDEIFSRYMYYERAKKGHKSSTTEALRTFYMQDGCSILKKEETFNNIITLAKFWKEVDCQNEEFFSERILRRFFVLKYAPNSMWTYFVSVYYMVYKDENGLLNEEDFYTFLDKTIAFTLAYNFFRPGVNALRTPIYAEMINIVSKNEVTFKDFKIEEPFIVTSISNFAFLNSRAITKSMLTWWAYQNDKQPLLDNDVILEIEHIYARNRYESEKSLSNKAILESLGNKSLLEKRINIRASDFRFNDKKKYYNGFTLANGKKKEGTKIVELVSLASAQDDFSETNIAKRKQLIVDSFISYLRSFSLLK